MSVSMCLIDSSTSFTGRWVCFIEIFSITSDFVIFNDYLVLEICKSFLLIMLIFIITTLDDHTNNYLSSIFSFNNSPNVVEPDEVADDSD